MILRPGDKASEYRVHNIITMSLYASHFQKNNCRGSKIKRDILALWFEYLWKKHYYHITGNQIHKTKIKEDHTNSARK